MAAASDETSGGIADQAPASHHISGTEHVIDGGLIAG